MSEKIGRLGYLGLAIEAVAGTAESAPDIFIPFTENDLRGHHEPIMDNAAHASRVKDFSSVQGKKWGEGSVSMYLDSLNAAYLFKLALGIEDNVSKTASIYDHLLTPTVSGNAPLSATLWDYKGVDAERYAYMCVDNIDLEITNEGIATITASLKGKFPSTVTAPTLTVPSGTLYTWKDTTVQLGSTVAAARAASATKMINVKLSIANALELTYKTGSNQPDTIVTGPIEVTGEYTLYFESVTERDAYYNLTKRSMIISMTGAGLGSGYTEKVEIVLKKLVLEDIDMETGLDDLFTITGNFRAEWDQDQAGFAEVMFRNGKTSTYA